jgi:exodeoxyribonuclease V alpha subunit
MVDILLMQALVCAMKPGCRLILVGDADQLPSVGPGNVFSDIIRSQRVETVRLTEIFRQAKESRIVKNAHLINQGILPDLGDRNGDFFFLQRSSPAKTAEAIVSLCSERLPANMGIDPSQIQVLPPPGKMKRARQPQRTAPGGAESAWAGKKRENLREFCLPIGDKVMQIRNHYDIIWRSSDGTRSGTGVFNGDIGLITEIDYIKELVTVDFEDKLVTYSYEQLGELEPAYAMTVHKSQGSEYRVVILAASYGAPQLLYRGVLYTAVTRARDLLIIVGSGDVVGQMVANDNSSGGTAACGPG